MKKENIFGLLMYLLIFAFAVVYGLTVLQTHFQNSTLTEVWQYAIYIIGSILVGIIISAILFELGHYVGAKVGGYKIVKFTILYFTIYLENDKYKFGFRKYEGITGETIIVPNYQKKEKPNPLPFLLYGPIFNLAWFIGTLVVFFYFNKGTVLDTDIAYAFLTVGLISAILFIYDIIPIKTDVNTNGAQLSILLKTKDIVGYNNLLEGKGELSASSDSKKDKKEAKAEPTINVNSVEGKLFAMRLAIDEKKTEEASALIGELLQRENELTSKTHLEVLEEQIYLKIMNTEYDEMAKYYDESVPLSLKRDISSDHSIVGIRTYILMAGLFDKSRSECVLALSKVAKAYKNTLPGRKHAELVLFNEALEKVCLAHPKWELDIYKLYE